MAVMTDIIFTDENKEEMNQFFLELLCRILKPASFSWLVGKVALIRSESGYAQLSQAFAQTPRFATKALVALDAGESTRSEKFFAKVLSLGATLENDRLTSLSKYTIASWTEETLCRVWMLMQIPVLPKENYIEKINRLFVAAELNEQVALYSALPFLEYPENWISRCEEGIRSNIGLILEAIMYYNPYPAANLSEPAWNQMILKAFFTDKDINKVSGIKDRLNKDLSDTLIDYVKERESAGRTVNPDIYQLIIQ